MSLTLTPQVAIAALICFTIAALAWLLLRSRRTRQVKHPSEEVTSTDPTLLTDAGSLSSVGSFIVAMLSFLPR